MKKILCSATLAASLFVQAQISGNINYDGTVHLPQNYLNVQKPHPNETLIAVKGLANIKADSYVAIFSVTQVGKTQEEATRIIDERINTALTPIRSRKNVETYVDVISFVPNYEYVVQNKIFSKTYNEVPAGFEIKKNIHVKFPAAAMLEDFMKILSQSEIYDLVRVDYHAAALEQIKKDLEAKAYTEVHRKIKKYELISGKTPENTERSVSDGFIIKLPLEMYQTYQASRSTTLNLRRSAQVNQNEKITSIFYQPVLNKEFDFVINPVIVEPVIQVMYELKVLISKKPEKNEREYVLLTPDGQLKTLNIQP